MEQEQKTREEALLKAFRNGDSAAFDVLIGMYSAKLYKVAYALLGSRQDAEEVVQDTFLRAYRALHAFRGESSLETWLHRIVLNLARNKYHWNHRRGDGLHVARGRERARDVVGGDPVGRDLHFAGRLSEKRCG